jgi:hypothetical protein
MFNYKDIENVHLEISSRCNASCPECPRNLRGGDIEDHGDYVVHDMTLTEAQTIFPPEFLTQIKNININGNHGDFITCRDGLKIVKYFADTNPDLNIEISTNASGQPKIWEPLARIPQLRTVKFRLDGLRDTHHLYRQYTDFDLIIANAKRFVAAGGNATWAMIKFDFNLHQIEQAKQMSIDLGFKHFELIDHGRNNTVVFNREGVYTHSIGTPDPDIRDYASILATRQWLREHGEHDVLYQRTRYDKTHSFKNITCKVLKPAAIYVQSNGEVFPCCWLGNAPRTNKIPLGVEQTRSIMGNNNALEVGIADAIAWFSELEKTWTIDTVQNGKNWMCNATCGSDE